MSMPTGPVGTAYVIVRAITSRIPKDIADGVNKAIANSDLKSAGDRIGSEISQGVERATDDIGESVGDKVVDNLKDSHKDASDAGSDVGDKISRGVNDGVDRNRRSFRARLQGALRAAYRGVGATVGARLGADVYGSFNKKLGGLAQSRGIQEVSGIMKMLSGWNSVEKKFDFFGRLIRNVDTLVPKLAGAGMAISSLFSLIGVGTANVISLIGSIGTIFPLLLMLPALLGNLGVVFGVLIAVMKDAGEYLGHLKGRFVELQEVLSDNFWDVAAEPISNMVEALLPALNNVLGETATDLGSLFAGIAGLIERNVAGFDKFIGNVNKGIRAATPGFVAFASALGTLGLAGSEFLERFGTSWTNMSEQFAAWSERVVADGSFEMWISRGAQAAKDLWSSLVSIVEIFSIISGAAAEAGSTTLGTMAEGLRGVTEALSKPERYEALVTFFRALRETAAGLAPGLSAIVDAFVVLAPTLGDLGPKLTGLVSTLAIGLAGALSNPLFAEGLTKFFDGVSEGIDKIAPFLPKLGEVFGHVATAAGTLAPILGDVLAAAFTHFETLLPNILAAFEAIAPVLGETLVSAIETLAPLIETVVRVVSNWAQENPKLAATLVMIVGSLAGVVKVLGMFGMAGKALKPLASIFGVIWKVVSKLAVAFGKVAIHFLKFIGPIGWIITAIMALAAAFTWAYNNIEPFRNVVDAVASAIMGAFRAAVEWLQGAWESVVSGWGSLVDFFGGLGGSVSGAFDGVMDAIGSALDWIQGVWDGLWGGLSSGVSSGLTAVQGVWDSVWGGITGAISDALTWIAEFWSSVWNGIVAAFWTIIEPFMPGITAFMTGLLDLISAIMDVIRFLWDMAWTGMMMGVQLVWTMITEAVTVAWNFISTFLSAGLQVLQTIFTTVWTAISTIVMTAWNFISTNVSAAIAFVSNIISSTLAIIQAVFSNVWAVISSIVSSQMSRISSIVSTVMSVIRSVFSAAWNTIRSTVTTAINAIRTIISSGMNTARNAVRTATTAITNLFRNGFNQARNAVRTAVNAIMTIVRGIPGRITGALGNLGNLLRGAGRSVIQGLIGGINSMLGNVGSAMGGIASKIRSFLPFSPVKEGPLRAWNNGRPGKTLMKMLAGGITSGGTSVTRAVRSVADSIASVPMSVNGLSAPGLAGVPSAGSVAAYARNAGFTERSSKQGKIIGELELVNGKAFIRGVIADSPNEVAVAGSRGANNLGSRLGGGGGL